MIQNESFSSDSSEDSDSSTEATTNETYEIVPRENLQATLPCTSNQAQAQEKPRENKDYELQIECQSLAEAIDYINQLDSVKWTRPDIRRTNEGETIAQKSVQKDYLLLTTGTELTSVYPSNDQHHYSDEPNAYETSLPIETRDKIYELLNMGLTKNKNILREIERQNLQKIAKCQLPYTKAYWK
ncbi:hypothetical protein BpHYR1_028941 [Brachionus plicatilis]|uniref:Uncharacterized protein n=1 Tax=Brachionus plicatilis TaxID=10195 RepID=A0A3M7S098_BRAPC|nr:hypothetical protein BpHYR1_028941 [Brachionus plicatilis]